MAYEFNQTPGDPSPGDAGYGGANSLNAKMLVELRVITYLLTTLTNGLLSKRDGEGPIQEYDLNNIRADPSSLGQRLG